VNEAGEEGNGTRLAPLEEALGIAADKDDAGAGAAEDEDGGGAVLEEPEEESLLLLTGGGPWKHSRCAEVLSLVFFRLPLSHSQARPTVDRRSR
jgi:hypothetical protein